MDVRGCDETPSPPASHSNPLPESLLKHRKQLLNQELGWGGGANAEHLRCS